MIKVSVIIPSFNGQELLEKHLPVVLRALNGWQKQGWEVIVVDDASTDGTAGFLRKKFSQVKIVTHRENLRFAESCNSGVKQAKGAIVLLLNNDVSPRKDFLLPLLEKFKEKDVFAVGCLEKEPGREKAFGRGKMFFKRGLVLHCRAEKQEEPTTDWVSGGSGAFDRKKWWAFGGMDRLFRPAYEEDRDLSYRALKHGFKVLFCPESVVFHHHETTNREALGKRQMRLSSYKNQFLFVWKNITDFDYFIRHLFWLPYHLIVGGIKTKGEIVTGFGWALNQLPEALQSRRKVKSFFKKKDKSLI